MVDGQNAGIEYVVWIGNNTIKESELADDFEMAFFAGGAFSGFHKIPKNAEEHGYLIAQTRASIGDGAMFILNTIYKRLKDSIFIVDKEKGEHSHLHFFKCYPHDISTKLVMQEIGYDHPSVPKMPDYPYDESFPL